MILRYEYRNDHECVQHLICIHCYRGTFLSTFDQHFDFREPRSEPCAIHFDIARLITIAISSSYFMVKHWIMKTYSFCII